ncbi:MAG: energy-coupled thiamine transporter ThiT [Oscillospiraceae bacterium]|nr:energy-coupled thiamine transporter ThiT [Oscillospiraceae bacterium]
MKNNLRRLCEGAIMVAIAQILSYIKLWEMPWGGSIVLAMGPIILFSVRWGLGSGLLAGFVFGVLQFMFDGGFAIGWQSIIGDYLLAFTVLGLAGLMKGKKLGVFWGTLIGGVARFLVHYVVGATIWAAYMPDTFFGMTMTSPWIYSLLYNIAYMGPNIIITLVIFGLLYVPMKKYMLGQDIH